VSVGTVQGERLWVSVGQAEDGAPVVRVDVSSPAASAQASYQLTAAQAARLADDLRAATWRATAATAPRSNRRQRAAPSPQGSA
jgi:hypothetical protein